MQNKNQLKNVNIHKTQNVPFQKMLDDINDGVIGVEYVLELIKDGTQKPPSYHCVLCRARGNSFTIISHLKGTRHKAKVLNKHFPIAHKLILSKVPRLNRHHFIIKVAQAIQTTFGRLQHKQLSDEEFKANRNYFFDAVKNSQHLEQTLQYTFADLIQCDEVPPQGVLKNIDSKKTGNQIPVFLSESKDTFSSISTNSGSCYSENIIVKDLATAMDGSQQQFSASETQSFVDPNLKKDIEEQLARELRRYREIPEEHPKYKEEWGKFWTQKYMESQAAGKELSNVDVLAVWRTFWEKRVEELHLEYRAKAFRMLGIEETTPVLKPPQPLITSKCEPKGPEKGSRKRRISESSDNDSSRSSRPKVSSPLRRGSPSRRRTSPSGRRESPSRRKRSPGRRRESLSRRKSPSRRRDSPAHRKDSTTRKDSPREKNISHLSENPPIKRKDQSQQRGESSSRFLRKESPQGKDSGSRKKSPAKECDSSSHHEAPAQREDSSCSKKTPTDCTESTPKEDSSSVSRESPVRKINSASTKDSSPIKNTQKCEENLISEDDIEILSVLRLLIALEDHLGSFGAKVMDLFSKAMVMENEKVKSSSHLLDNNNCILLKSVQEKLKGQLQIGLVSELYKKPYETVISNIENLLDMVDQRRKRQVVVVKEEPIPSTGTQKSTEFFEGFINKESQAPSKAGNQKKQNDTDYRSSCHADLKSGRGDDIDIDGVPLTDDKLPEVAESSVPSMEKTNLFTRSNFVAVSNPNKGTGLFSKVTITSDTNVRLKQDKTVQNINKRNLAEYQEKSNKIKSDVPQLSLEKKVPNATSSIQDAKKLRQTETSSRNTDTNTIKDYSQSTSRQSGSGPRDNGSQWRRVQRTAGPQKNGGLNFSTVTGRNDYRYNRTDHRNKFSNEARRGRR